MGYACPVCETPQADGEHLANHLAFTAMLHGDAHEEWLEAHVSDWADRDPDGLAADVVEHAEPVDHETVFEDTTDGAAERGAPDVDPAGLGAGDRPEGALDPETRRVVGEARELTERMRGEPDGEE